MPWTVWIIVAICALFAAALILVGALNLAKTIIKRRKPRQWWESDAEYQGDTNP